VSMTIVVSDGGKNHCSSAKEFFLLFSKSVLITLSRDVMKVANV